MTLLFRPVCVGVKVVSIDNGKAGRSLLFDFDRSRGGGVATLCDEPEELEEFRSTSCGGGGVGLGDGYGETVEALSELRLGEGDSRGVEGMVGNGGMGGATLERGEGDLPIRALRGLICVYVSDATRDSEVQVK